MARALTEQFLHAGCTLNKYGWDDSHTVMYYFDQTGFRCPRDFVTVSGPDILFFGGSMSFGIGVNYEDTYPFVTSHVLGKSFRNLSYAQHLYNNALIYATACYAAQTHNTNTAVIQWVSDKRTPKSQATVYDYVRRLNNLYSVCVHIMIDGLENNLENTDGTFALVNPPWVDTVANNTHPGIRTHQGIAKFLIKRLESHVS